MAIVGIFELMLYTFALLLTIPAVSFLFATVYIWLQHRKYAHIPGPPLDSFYLGNVLALKKMYSNGQYYHDLFLEWVEAYGDLIKITAFHKVMLLPTSQTLIKELLTKSYLYPKAPQAYARLSQVCSTRFMGSGLVTNTNHAEWYRRRSAINPAFHRRFLQTMLDNFNVVADKWIESLRPLADGKTMLCMADHFSYVTLNVMGQVAFSMDLSGVNSKIGQAITRVLEAVCICQKDPFIQWRPSKKAFVNEVQQATLLLREAAADHIQERITATSAGEHTPNDILTLLLESREQNPDLTLDDLVDDFLTLFIAGQETTSNILAFMLNELGRNHDILTRLRQEVTDVVGSNAVMSYSALCELEYLTQVWRETLRLYPPAPGTARTVLKETTIDGYHIPAGSFVIFSFYVNHRLTKHWSKPLQFDPDRWGHDTQRPLYAYMPFSLGSRACAGQIFAQFESKILMSKFLQAFDFQLDPSQSFDVEDASSLRPKGGCMVTLTCR